MDRLTGIDLTRLTQFQRLDEADGRSDAAVTVADAGRVFEDAAQTDTDHDGRITLKEFAEHCYTPQQMRQLARAFGRFQDYAPLNARFRAAATARGDWTRALPLSADELQNLRETMQTEGIDPQVVQTILRDLLTARGGGGDSEVVWLAVSMARITAAPGPTAADLLGLHHLFADARTAERALFMVTNSDSSEESRKTITELLAGLRDLTAQGMSPDELRQYIAVYGTSASPLHRFATHVRLHDTLFGAGSSETRRAVLPQPALFNGVTGNTLVSLVPEPAARQALLQRLGPESFAELVHFVEHSAPEITARRLTINQILTMTEQLRTRGINRVGRLSVAAAEALQRPVDPRQPQTLYVAAHADGNGAIYQAGANTRFIIDHDRGLQFAELRSDDPSRLEAIPDNSLTEVVIHGHGTPRSIHMGGDKQADASSIDPSDPQWAILARKLKPGGRIVLLSCSTGGTDATQNMLDFFYSLVRDKGISVVAPSEPVAAHLEIDPKTGLLVPAYRSPIGDWVPVEQRP